MEIDGDPDDLLAFALASGKTWKEAGAAAGVGNTTIHRRLKDTAFQERIREFRKQMVIEAMGRAVAGLTDSITILQDIAIACPVDAVRVSAARACIEAADKLRRNHDQQEQLDAMRAEIRELRSGLEGGTERAGGTSSA